MFNSFRILCLFFRCANCDKTFPTGERVTFTGKSCLCTACAKISSNSNAASPR